MKIRPTHRSGAVARAIQWRGTGEYRLGSGHGNDPFADTPLAHGYADCSNFCHWVIGSVLNRRRDGYYNTDGILYDSHGLLRGGGSTTAPQRVFTRFTGDALPGDLIVRPGRYAFRNGKRVRLRAGHMGIVVQTLPGYSRDLDFESEGHRLIRVVHCSTFGSYKPPAIRETDGKPWASSGYMVRYLGYDRCGSRLAS